MTEKRIRTLFTGRLFDVTQRIVRLDGRRHLYETVRHPGSCAILPIVSPQTLLLLRQFRPSIGKTFWEIPAGTMERGESALRCAKREVEEETGYRAGRLTLLTMFYPSPGFCTERIHLFSAQKLEPLSQRLEKDEKIRVHTVTFRKAFRLLQEGSIVDAKTLIALYLLKFKSVARLGKL